MKTIRHAALVLIFGIYGLYAVVICVACLLIGGVIALLMPSLAIRRVLARWTLRTFFFLAVMPYRFDGLDRLPDGPSVVIANHRSYLDGLVLLAALPPRFSAVIKQEIADIPFIGWFLRHIGCRFVEREPAIVAGRDTRDLLEALQAGESLAIFPEGTFSTDAGLLPFRDGAFFMAAKAGAPVVPALIEGPRRILPEERILPWPGRLAVKVFAAIHPDGNDRAAGERLRDRAEHAFANRLRPHAPHRDANRDDHAYYQRVFRGRPLPLAYLDLDRLEGNIRSVLERSGGKHLRIDARTLQCPDVIHRVLRSNVRFHGIKCSTVVEALYLHEHVKDAKDILVAYPTVQPDTLDMACAAIAEGRDITLTVDAPAHLGPLSAAAGNNGVEVPVCVEIDMSTADAGLKGTGRRSAVRSIDALLEMVAAIDRQPGLRFRGVLTYDSQRNQIAEWVTGDGSSGEAELSARNARHLRQQRHALREALAARGHKDPLVNCGGVGSMAFNATHSAVTEITVGAALFGLDPEDPADIPTAGYAAEVIRRPDQNLYACLTGVHTSTDVSDARHLPYPYLPHGARLDALHGAGEAQLPVRYDGDLAIGDMVFLHPADTDELCERFGRLLLVQNGSIVDEAETYRA